MSKDEKVKFSELTHFFGRQREALEATKKFKFVLYGGSMGSGKSYFLRWSLLYWLMYWYAAYDIRGVRVGLFCESFPSLVDRHLSKIKTEFPPWLGTYNEQRHEFTLSPQFGSGVLAFRNLDDVEKYLSVEFAAEAVDELNRNPKQTFSLLRTRLRWPGIKETKFMGACNPVGEVWVKNYWIKRLFPKEEEETQEFYFVKSLPTDNPHLDSSYFEGLKSLPEAERKAYLEGDWDAFNEFMDESGWIRLLSDTEFQQCQIPAGEHGGVKILGIDPAAGGDNSTIVLKSANLQEILFNQKLKDVMSLSHTAFELFRKHQCSLAVVDKTGIGQGVFDRLKQLNIDVRGVSFGEKATDEAFYNLKAELYWKERQWLLSGGRLIHNPGWNEFEIIKYKAHDGRVKIQPKEELFRHGLASPNCVDAAVLTQYIPDSAISSMRVYHQHRGQFYDHMSTVWRQG